MPEKLGSQVTPGVRRRDRAELARAQINSGLVRELSCVESLVYLFGMAGHTQGIISQKRFSAAVQRPHIHRNIVCKESLSGQCGDSHEGGMGV